MEVLLLNLLNGLQLSMLIFLLAVGLTLIFGLMDLLNLAHGAFYTMGAYAGLVVVQGTGSYWMALAFAPLALFVVGALINYFILQPLGNQGRSNLDIALFTFGLLFVTMGVAEYVFGVKYATIAPPEVFRHGVKIFGTEYPTYRLFVIGLGLLVATILWLVLDRTVVGAIVRAGVNDRRMVIGMGINISIVFAVVFGVGAALAGLAGVVAAPLLSVYSHMGMSILIVTFIVVVIGGLGNFKGSFFGSLIVGMTDTLTGAYVQGAELFAIYAVLAVVLIYKPQGLFTRQTRTA
jgi:branched-chain amino acid transport system permease protein